MRRAAKRDDSEAAIVQALEQGGWAVSRVNGIPGFPDLIVARGGEMHLIECKTKNGTLTEAQEEFHRLWTGPPILVFRSVEDVVAWLGGDANPR
ncbi:MAG: hypothetical protein ACJ79O_26960 [Myxococcales bacterium]